MGRKGRLWNYRVSLSGLAECLSGLSLLSSTFLFDWLAGMTTASFTVVCSLSPLVLSTSPILLSCLPHLRQTQTDKRPSHYMPDFAMPSMTAMQFEQPYRCSLLFDVLFKEYETWMNYNPEIRYVTSPVTRDLPISYGQIWKLVWWYRSGSQPNVTQVLPWIIPKQCAKF